MIKSLLIAGREIAGWMLVLIGLGFAMQSTWLLGEGKFVEGGVAALIAVFVFRGGIGLVRIAAASAVLRASDERTARRTST